MKSVSSHSFGPRCATKTRRQGFECYFSNFIEHLVTSIPRKDGNNEKEAKMADLKPSLSPNISNPTNTYLKTNNVFGDQLVTILKSQNSK